MHLRAAAVIKRPGFFHRLTGLSVAEFERLLPVFTQAYHHQVIQPRLLAPERVRSLGGGQKGALKEVGDKLLFILVYTRVYPLLLVQGMFAWRWQRAKPAPGSKSSCPCWMER